jgi:hypothetical protein
MPVKPTKPRVALIVHGVQTGADKDQNQHLDIKELIKNRLGNIPLKYKTDIYRYEDINDKTIAPAKKLVKMIAKTPVAGKLAESTMDLVGDVVLSLADRSTAARVRAGLKKKILAYYQSGNPCYLVAHSLGSIYALDVVNELINETDLFDREHRSSWPVQGLLTIGSPIGLGMFRKDRLRLSKMGPGTKLLRWKNCWDRNDPVVSGNIFGKTISGFDIAEKYQSDDKELGWFIKDVPVNTGKLWLASHIAYWELPEVGDILVEMMAN